MSPLSLTVYQTFHMKHWQLKEQAPESYINPLLDQGFNPILAQVFFSRGFTDPTQVEAFLGRYDEDDNPFRLADMEEAVYRLRMAIRNEEPIAVYGDFDADGVTSTVLLTNVLRLLGAEHLGLPLLRLRHPQQEARPRRLQPRD